jgi:hypothetical protein
MVAQLGRYKFEVRGSWFGVLERFQVQGSSFAENDCEKSTF